jgi:YD repeat-containing protein
MSKRKCQRPRDRRAFNLGLELSYEELTLSTGTVLSQLNFTWAQTPTSLNPYIGTTVTKLNPGQTYEDDKQTTQTLDQYGNLLTMQAYNFGLGSVGSLARTYTNTYLSNSNYTPLYIFNRLVTSTVTDGTNTATLVSNTYDTPGLATVTGLYEHDANYSSTFFYRGNVTSSTTPTTSTTTGYDITGNIVGTRVNGVSSAVVLAFAGCHAFQLFNVVRSGAVIRICGENGYRAPFGRFEIAVAF